MKIISSGALAAALLLLLAPGAICELSPSIKWAQDRKHLLVTVAFDCAKSKTFKPDELKFHLECTGAKGKQTMSFGLREHIDPANSSCKTVKEGEELCTLEKKFPHFFDRLVENPDELKHLKQDWFRWNDEDENSLPDDPYDGVNASLVKPFRTANITQALKDGKVVFADISFPWCGTCSFSKKPFITAAKKLSSDNVVFARLDAREDKEAASKYNTSCDQTCEFVVLRGEDDAEVFKGEANADDMLKVFKSYVSPPMTTVASDAEVDAFRAKYKTSALVLLQGSWTASASSSKEYKAVKAAARKTRGKVHVMYAEKSLKGISPPAVKLFVKGEEAPVDVPLDVDADVLAKNLVLRSLPALDDYKYDKRQLHKEYPLPVGMIWVPPKDEAKLAVAKALAEQLRGKVMMLKMGSSESFMMKDFGVDDKETLLFGITTGFEPTSDRFLYEGSESEWSAEALGAFADKAVKGDVPKAHKSEPIPPPEEWEKGQVRPVGGGGGGGADCAAQGVGVWRREDVAALDKVAEAMEDVEGVTVAKMEISKNYVDPLLFPNVEEYEADPVAFLCHGGEGPCERYTGALTQKDLLKLLAKAFPTVKAQWEGKVKPKLKAVKEAAKEKKEKEEREKAEALAKLEAERKEREEKLATVEKQDVSLKKNGDVIKQVLTEGEGVSPVAGDDVTVHYTGTLLDGSKFDSSRDRDSPFTFGLASRQVISCWDEGVATMKKAERAVLTCQPAAAYGERGAPPKIPANAVLQFDVELIDFKPKAAKEEL
eukprot:CAMPEP_0181324438 /NCGR_PEP_ID=MMETSP1101-20121128/20360_1 /TAXON_ID=46948 /ORGANISM="Rhodomonas abbreviata, Strain Caron Lab Isolate" /LENGTH=770 /DNA_ID=CAMNT_0023432615 /DNA_START=57 /DNA_END=2370 /DNA_ORIENTATION=-